MCSKLVHTTQQKLCGHIVKSDKFGICKVGTVSSNPHKSIYFNKIKGCITPPPDPEEVNQTTSPLGQGCQTWSNHVHIAHNKMP